MFQSRGHFRRVAVLFLMLFSLTAVVPMAASAQGNSDAAHLCQQGGYAALVGTGGETFANTGECVSFAAQGGIFATGIIVPAGHSVTYNSTLGGCNELTFGYSASDGTGDVLDSIPNDGCPGSQTGGIASGTIGPFATAVIFTVYLTDGTCGVTYDSTDVDSGHVVVSGSAPSYQVDIADGGYGCTRTGNITGFNMPGNLSVSLEIHP